MTTDDAGPRVEVDQYTVYPTGYEHLVNTDKGSWCLTVSNGHKWGWKITRGLGGDSSGVTMNRKGEFIFESRGSGHNKARRWPLDEIQMREQHPDVTTHEPRALGALIRRLIKDGHAVKNGRFGESTRPEAHKATVWFYIAPPAEDVA